MSKSIKAFVVGESGSGKTRFAATFPKSYWIMTEPGGYDTVEYNEELKKNTVVHKYLLKTPIKGIKEVFDELKDSIKEAYEMQAKGEIETLIIDNATYLAELRWDYINQYEKAVSNRTGEEDKLSMFRKLSDWQFDFYLTNCAAFPGSVVATSHVRREHEEAMGRKAGDDDIVPDILGGFRNQAHGMFSICMFLEYVNGKHIARLKKGKGKLAKNRYNLPEIMENVTYGEIVKNLK